MRDVRCFIGTSTQELFTEKQLILAEYEFVFFFEIKLNSLSQSLHRCVILQVGLKFEVFPILLMKRAPSRTR